jgi:hypothetical protein
MGASKRGGVRQRGAKRAEAVFGVRRGSGWAHSLACSRGAGPSRSLPPLFRSLSSVCLFALCLESGCCRRRAQDPARRSDKSRGEARGTTALGRKEGRENREQAGRRGRPCAACPCVCLRVRPFLSARLLCEWLCCVSEAEAAGCCCCSSLSRAELWPVGETAPLRPNKEKWKQRKSKPVPRKLEDSIDTYPALPSLLKAF